MKKFLILLAVLVLAMTAILAVAGCTESVEDAEAAYDEALDEFRTAVVDYESLDMDSTKDEVNDATDALEDSWSKLQDAAADYDEAADANLEDAYGDLEKAINDVPGDATAEEALEMVQPEIQAVKDAYDAM